MNPNAYLHGSRSGDRGIVGAAIVAILFAIVAAISFAVDQSVTLSLPDPPAQGPTR